MLKMLILFKTVFVMSVGDKKNSGNKGNNFPWQYKVLLGLQGIADNTDLVESLLQQIENNTDGVEGLLGQILAAVQSDKDFEASFAKDANDVTWLEIRTLDLDTNVWSIAYYLPGDLTVHQLQPGDPAGPLGPLTYESPAALLALILAELVAHTALLTDIDNNTDNVETLLTNLGVCCAAGNVLLQSIDAKDFATEATLNAFATANNAALGLIETAIGTADVNIVAAIQACCTSQGTILSNILTELQSQTGLITSIDSNTSLVLAELVAQTVQNASIIAALSPLATEVTLASVLAELQTINTNTTGLSQEATQLLVLAALSTIETNTTGVATEVTLASLLTAFNAEDFATETTLALIQAITAQMTFTASALNVALPSGSVTPSLQRITSGSGTVAAGAHSVSFYNAGDQSAVVLGESLLPGERVNYPAPAGKTLGAIAYNVGAAILGEIRDLVITKVV